MYDRHTLYAYHTPDEAKAVRDAANEELIREHSDGYWIVIPDRVPTLRPWLVVWRSGTRRSDKS